jgi:hypothetical protein
MGKVFGVLLAVAMSWQASPAHAEEQHPAASTAGATPAPATLAPEKPTRPGRTRDRNAGARIGLIVGGSVAFGVFYGLPCAGGRGLWCVPFAGPILVVAKREREQSRSADAGEDGIVPPAFIYTLAGGLGMLQLTGAALITAGALLPRREVTVTAGGVTLLPMVSSSTAGLAAIGTW